MTVYKAGQYTYTKPLIISLNVPLIDTGNTAEQMRRKMVAATDDFLDEFSRGPVDISAMIDRFHDLVHTVSSYVLADSREKNPQLVASEMVRSRFAIGSDRHNARLIKQAVERGWTVIAE